MAAFEWMELQTLTSDITLARSRLAAARVGRDDRSVRTLEQEITAAEQRRARLLAFLTSHLADGAHDAPLATANEDAPPGRDAADLDGDDAPEPAVASIAFDEMPQEPADDEPAAEHEPPVEAEPPAEAEAEAAERMADSGNAGATASLAPYPQLKGDNIVWDQLTPGDLDRAKEEIDARRDEMLARHAEELRTLDADRDELATLEQAIAGFLRKFSASPGAAEVVSLGDERELRAVGRG